MSLSETVVMNNTVLIFFYERVFFVCFILLILSRFLLRRALQVCFIIVTGPVSFWLVLRIVILVIPIVIIDVINVSATLIRVLVSVGITVVIFPPV